VAQLQAALSAVRIDREELRGSVRTMKRHRLLPSPLAGACALGAGHAWIAWIAINSRTHGGLDAGPPAVGAGVARTGMLLMVAWNVLLLPAALVLHQHLETGARMRMRLVSLAGVASLLLWAYGGATRTITTPLEVSYIALSAVWWGGLGWELRAEHRWFGTFTLVLAVFAVWDAVLTGWAGVPFALYLTAAPKLPLSIIWDFWLAWLLLAPLALAATPRPTL
jgi:hypothetical protein